MTEGSNSTTSGVARLAGDRLQVAKNKLLHLGYGKPTKHLRIIVVAGTSGATTTACFINEILKEAKFTTALYTSARTEIAGDNKSQTEDQATSARDLHRFFRTAKRADVEYVIVEASDYALRQRQFEGMSLEAVVLAGVDKGDVPGQPLGGYTAALAKLLALQPRFMVLNRDDEVFEKCNAFVAAEQKMTYGTHSEAEARISRIKLYRKGTEADLTIDHQTHLELATYLLGEKNVSYMTAAVTLAYLLGVKLEDIQEGVANLEDVP